MHPVEDEDAPSRSQTEDAIWGGDRLLDREPKQAVQRGRGLQLAVYRPRPAHAATCAFPWSVGVHIRAIPLGDATLDSC